MAGLVSRSGAPCVCMHVVYTMPGALNTFAPCSNPGLDPEHLQCTMSCSFMSFQVQHTSLQAPAPSLT